MRCWVIGGFLELQAFYSMAVRRGEDNTTWLRNGGQTGLQLRLAEGTGADYSGIVENWQPV